MARTYSNRFKLNVVAQSQFPAWRQGMGLNEWREIPNTGWANAVTPSWDALDMSPGYRSAASAWCGASIDTRDSTIYTLCFGGHSTWTGNPAIKLRLSADNPVWQEAAPCTPQASICTFVDAGGSIKQCRRNNDEGVSRTGSPPSAHTYYGNQFIEVLNRAMLFATVALQPTGGYPQVVGLNPATNDYEPDLTYPDIPYAAGPDDPVCKDPTTEKVYHFGADTNRWAIYDPADNTFVRQTGSPFRTSVGPVAVDTRRNRILHVSNDASADQPCYTLDLATKTFTSQTLGGLGRSVIINDPHPDTGLQGFTGWGMVFVQHPTDAAQDYFYLKQDKLAGGGFVYRINASTFVLDELTTTGGGAIAVARNLSGTTVPGRLYNKWLYVPQYGVIVFFNDYDHNVWALRVV